MPFLLESETEVYVSIYFYKGKFIKFLHILSKAEAGKTILYTHKKFFRILKNAFISLEYNAQLPIRHIMCYGILILSLRNFSNTLSKDERLFCLLFNLDIYHCK